MLTGGFISGITTRQVEYASWEYLWVEFPINSRLVKRTRQSKQKNVIGERVRIARLACKPPVSQDDLSGRLARLGVQITQTSLSKLENQSRYVMDYEALALAKALKVSVVWLFGQE